MSPRFSLLIFAVFGFVGYLSASDDVGNNVEGAFSKHQVIPDVVDKAPDTLLHAKYSKAEPNLGNEVTLEDAAEEPTLSWKADHDTFYTIIMLDPDAPSRSNPTRRSWVHWLVVNVPGQLLDHGTTLASYNGPKPPSGTGPHRYVILAYKQQQKMQFTERFPDTEKGKRAKFNLAAFKSRYLLGDAVAGNFFIARPSLVN